MDKVISVHGIDIKMETELEKHSQNLRIYTNHRRPYTIDGGYHFTLPHPSSKPKIRKNLLEVAFEKLTP